MTYPGERGIPLALFMTGGMNGNAGIRNCA